MKREKIKKILKKHYSKLAKENKKLGLDSPIAFAKIRKGEIVLDLGSGRGFDCFEAAKKVEEKGKVFGIDMSKEMIKKAKENAEAFGFTNVEFIESEIENLPLEEKSIDVVISNCVINLSPEKQKVFNEAFRVLKPRGRLIISDLIAKKDLPKEIRENENLYVSCIGGAVLEKDYLKMMKKAGFKRIKILGKKTNSCCQTPDELISNIIFSAIK